MSSHAMIISATQWQQVFITIIFPLFERAGARSRIAMISKEEAIAPELKKGNLRCYWVEVVVERLHLLYNESTNTAVCA